MDEHPDWAVVVLFYCAVQMVEVMAAAESLHNHDHAMRNRWVKERFSSIWGHYRVLQQESLKTRYLEGGDFNITTARARNLRQNRLAPLIDDIEARLNARGPVIETKVKKPVATK
ncbi:MAG: hypothetical protein HND58_00515 [Planctomycetota bacterium]|nr:MAG: hypothetical protein HND58_00515 [Planctomycetota bacterium]